MTLLSIIPTLLICGSLFAQQNKINLEDVKIKGEGLRGSTISLEKGDKTDLEKHLTIRRDFREDIVNALPPEFESKRKK